MKTKNTKILWLTVISIFVTAIIMSTFSACTTTPNEPEVETGPKYVAHRGYSQYYVDNTEESFLAAASTGFYGIETDIRKTQDGYYVCSHDDTVYYADNSSLKIADADLSELTATPLKNTKTNTDAYLCTFETYLRACKAGGKVAVIELKDYFSKNEYLNILKIVDKEYTREKITFISFSYATLKEAIKADPSIPTQYLSQTPNDTRFADCLRYNMSIDIKLSSNPEQNVVTEELVQTFHQAGLTVNVWTVDTEEDLQSAREYGVDYITTNVFHNS